MNDTTQSKSRWWTAFTAGVAGAVLAACAQTPSVVRDLPELPAEYAKDLAPATSAPVLMTKPVAAPQPAPPRRTTPPLPLAIARACTAVFEGYVTFPMTVCYPPTIEFDRLALAQDAGVAPASRAGSVGVLPVSHFKLSSHSRVTPGFPWFCTVRSGPWFGHLEGAQICDVDPNTRLFTAQILGGPEPVVVTWTGALTDVPPPLKLVAITQTGEFCTCCSGFMCPDGSCKPNLNLCGTGPPAVK